MSDLLVTNLSEETVAGLAARAARHGRSVEAEHRAILEDAVSPAMRPEKAAWMERARKLREEFKGRYFTPSEDIIREMRDER